MLQLDETGHVPSSDDSGFESVDVEVQLERIRRNSVRNGLEASTGAVHDPTGNVTEADLGTGECQGRQDDENEARDDE